MSTWPLKLIVFLLGTLLCIAVTSAVGASLIFRNGFEVSTGSPDDVTGTWTGTVSFPGSVNRTIVLQFHQRANDKLLGYLLGSSEAWVMRSGNYSGGAMDVTLILGSPAGDRTVTLSGPVDGDTATLVVGGDLPAQSVEFTRNPGELIERRFILADIDPDFGEPHFVSLAVVLDDEDQLVAGSWSGSEQKKPLARDGGVTSLAITPDTITIGWNVDGGCSAGSQLEANFQPSLFLYFGTFTLIDCEGTQTGDFIGGFVDGTSSSDIASVLAQISAVADQIESGAPFSPPHSSFDADYLHEGTDLAGLFTSLNDEMTDWVNIDMDVLDISRIATRDQPNESFDISRPHGVDFHQVRSGEPTGGGPREEYLDTRSDELSSVTQSQLNLFALDSGVWKINGNQQQAFDLPWTSAEIQVGDRRLEVATSGDPIRVALGGYGGHFSPVGSHANGDRKANYAGFLPVDDSEMAELAGDGIGDDDGACSVAELAAGGCAYWAELDGSLVRQRIPWYHAPQNGVVHKMGLVSGSASSDYFDEVPHWQISLAFESGIKMELGHSGRIADGLADAVFAASGCDPRDLEACIGVGPGSDLLQGVPAIPISAGDPVAQPQVFADSVPGYDGYRFGGGGFPEYPWAQMEFNVSTVVGGARISTCVFALIDSERLAAYRSVMEADMADSYSQRYRPRHEFPVWAWMAEATLCNAPWQGPTDFSSLFTSLGGWFERTNAGVISDELVSFAPIAMDTGIFDAANYEPGTKTLILRRRAYFEAFTWTMPDASEIDTRDPSGEILNRTPSGLVVLWRNLGWVGGNVYQAAAYRLDEDGLTIKWGQFAASRGAAEAAAPTLDPGEACDEIAVICYFHKEQPGY